MYVLRKADELPDKPAFIDGGNGRVITRWSRPTFCWWSCNRGVSEWLGIPNIPEITLKQPKFQLDAAAIPLAMGGCVKETRYRRTSKCYLTMMSTKLIDEFAQTYLYCRSAIPYDQDSSGAVLLIKYKGFQVPPAEH